MTVLILGEYRITQCHQHFDRLIRQLELRPTVVDKFQRSKWWFIVGQSLNVQSKLEVRN